MSIPNNMPFHTIYTEFQDQQRTNMRWQNNSGDDMQQNTFARLTSGSHGSHQQGDVHRRLNTEVSYASHADKFRKTKFNQMETLKELRQEYEILRSLPLQDEFLGHSHTKKENLSDYSSSRQQDSESMSSKPSEPKRKRSKQSHSNVRETQVLSLEKKQLELVIGNSMRKIEELLNAEIEYKRVIHELQLQLDSRSSDDKVEMLTRTLKLNEREYTERNESLRREADKLKQSNAVLETRTQSLELELSARTQELRRLSSERREWEDSVRAERDKAVGLQLEIKRLKMEAEIFERDKTSEISRLRNMLDNPQVNASIAIQSGHVSRLEEDLKATQLKYEALLTKYQREVTERPKQVVREVVRPNNDEQSLRMMETILNHLKEDAAHQSKATVDMLSSMVAKLGEKNEIEKERLRDRKLSEVEEQKLKKKISAKSEMDEHTNRLLQELFHLRNEVTNLKEDKLKLSKSNHVAEFANSMADYQTRIRKMEEEIADGSVTKEQLMREYQNIRSTCEYTRDELERVNEENVRLKQRLNQVEQHGQMSSENLRISYREKEANLEESNRQLRRKVDEALLLVDRTKKEGELSAQLSRVELESAMNLLKEEVQKAKVDGELLKAELVRMKAFYEAKLAEKNALIEKAAKEYTEVNESQEKVLTTLKTTNEREMAEMVKKIEGMAELNERYLQQANLLANTERQLNELRYVVRRMKGLNEGVDHLWQVKETEYSNLNELVKQLRQN